MSKPSQRMQQESTHPHLSVPGSIHAIRDLFFKFLTPTLAAWLLRGYTALKSFLWETLFLDQLQDSMLLSLNSFLHPFL